MSTTDANTQGLFLWIHNDKKSNFCLIHDGKTKDLTPSSFQKKNKYNGNYYMFPTEKKTPGLPTGLHKMRNDWIQMTMNRRLIVSKISHFFFIIL